MFVVRGLVSARVGVSKARGIFHGRLGFSEYNYGDVVDFLIFGDGFLD